MGTQTLYRYFFTACLLMAVRFTGWASNSKPCPVAGFESMQTMHVAADTTQPKENKKPEDATDSKPEETIKEVPKSRKQLKPLAVTTVAIKPVVVKPKIVVKPIIKIH